MADPGPTSALLKAIREKKSQCRKRLAAIQDQIFEIEDHYLESTSASGRGNVVKGWEGLVDLKRNGLPKLANKRPKASDRIFSFSSTTAPIAKSELDRDEETEVALRWAESYAAAVARASQDAPSKPS